MTAMAFKKALEDAKLTDAKAAELLGCSTSSIKVWKEGEREPGDGYEEMIENIDKYNHERRRDFSPVELFEDELFDPNRSADATMRGFLTQFAWATKLWLEAPRDRIICVEGIEDVDIYDVDASSKQPVKVQLHQLKDYSGDVTVSNSAVYSSLFHALTYYSQTAASDVHLEYWFVTTATLYGTGSLLKPSKKLAEDTSAPADAKQDIAARFFDRWKEGQEEANEAEISQLARDIKHLVFRYSKTKTKTELMEAITQLDDVRNSELTWEGFVKFVTFHDKISSFAALRAELIERKRGEVANPELFIDALIARTMAASVRKGKREELSYKTLQELDKSNDRQLEEWAARARDRYFREFEEQEIYALLSTPSHTRDSVELGPRLKGPRPEDMNSHEGKSFTMGWSTPQELEAILAKQVSERDSGGEQRPHLTVILGRGGSGKTVLLARAASTLSRAGCPAFFIRATDLARFQDPKRLFDAVDARVFEHWRDVGEARGYLLIDAYDEAVVAGYSALDIARNLSILVEGATARTELVVSSRDAAWGEALDARVLLEALRPIAPVSMDDVEKSTEFVNCYELHELYPNQKITLARALGLEAPHNLLERIAASGAGEFFSTPLGFTWAAQHWRAHGVFGSRHELLRSHLAQKTTPSFTRPSTLTRARALSGARAVAGLMILQGSTSLSVNQDLPGGLDVMDVLADWTAAEIREFVQLPLFVTVPGDLQVIFKHRELGEYLAARWIEELRRAWNKHALGPFKTNDLYLGGLPGREEPALASRWTESAAWSAQWDEDVRGYLVRSAPDVLLSSGDPASLDHISLVGALERYTALLHDREYAPRRLLGDQARLAGVFQADLEKFLLDMLASNKRDVPCLALQISWTKTSLAIIARVLDRFRDFDGVQRRYAARVIGAHGTKEQISGFARLLEEDESNDLATTGNFFESARHLEPKEGLDLFMSAVSTDRLPHQLIFYSVQRWLQRMENSTVRTLAGMIMEKIELFAEGATGAPTFNWSEGSGAYLALLAVASHFTWMSDTGVTLEKADVECVDALLGHVQKINVCQNFEGMRALMLSSFARLSGPLGDSARKNFDAVRAALEEKNSRAAPRQHREQPSTWESLPEPFTRDKIDETFLTNLALRAHSAFGFRWEKIFFDEFKKDFGDESAQRVKTAIMNIWEASSRKLHTRGVALDEMSPNPFVTALAHTLVGKQKLSSLEPEQARAAIDFALHPPYNVLRGASGVLPLLVRHHEVAYLDFARELIRGALEGKDDERMSALSQFFLLPNKVGDIAIEEMERKGSKCKLSHIWTVGRLALGAGHTQRLRAWWHVLDSDLDPEGCYDAHHVMVLWLGFDPIAATRWLQENFEWFKRNDVYVFSKVRFARDSLGERYALFTSVAALAKLIELSALSMYEAAHDAPSQESLVWIVDCAKHKGEEVLSHLEILANDEQLRPTGWRRDRILDALATVRAELANRSRWTKGAAICELYRDHGLAALERLDEIDLYT